MKHEIGAALGPSSLEILELLVKREMGVTWRLGSRENLGILKLTLKCIRSSIFYFTKQTGLLLACPICPKRTRKSESISEGRELLWE